MIQWASSTRSVAQATCLDLTSLTDFCTQMAVSESTAPIRSAKKASLKCSMASWQLFGQLLTTATGLKTWQVFVRWTNNSMAISISLKTVQTIGDTGRKPQGPALAPLRLQALREVHACVMSSIKMTFSSDE